MKVLLLTHNVMTENDTQIMLQILGHEVFVSTELVNRFLTSKVDEIFNHFDVCIISKTISDFEAKFLAEQFDRFPCKIFREADNCVKNESVKSSLFFGYLYSKNTIVDLRESLAKVTE